MSGISPEVKQLVDRPNFAHLSTLMPDERRNPFLSGSAATAIDSSSVPAKVLLRRRTRRDPRIAISIIDFTNPYEEVQIRGRVAERRPDPELKVIDPISHKYTGKPFPMRKPEGRVALFIEVEKERYTKLPFEHTPPKR